MSAVIVVKVGAERRRELERIVSRPSEGARLVRRARVILLSASGETASEIGVRLDEHDIHFNSNKSGQSSRIV
jgi:hypothetical protein